MMNVLFFYVSEAIASTVYDHINSFQKYGRYNYTYIDISKEKTTLDYIEQFDALIIHYTLFLFNDNRCPPWLRLILRNTKAKKIIFIQDEYRLVNDVVENLNFIKADLLYTCVPEAEIEKVYPKEKLMNLIKINTLTGFVPEDFSTISRIPMSYENRKIDVVYRARKLSAWYGRLGQEKWIIAERFVKDAKVYGLVTDISYQEKDRIYGDEWIKLLCNAKAVIGCESGAGVFDFTGDIQRQVEQYEIENSKAPFEEIKDKFFKNLDGEIKLNQISPRCFECAALGTLMILYEGDYSGILQPWRHYVPLKKDHSNMKEVVEFIRTPQKWKEMTSCAYEEIAMNENYSYEHFIKKVEGDLIRVFGFLAPPREKHLGSDNTIRQESTKQSNFLKVSILNVLKKILAVFLGEDLKGRVLLLKRRIMLSVQTLRSLIKAGDKQHYKNFLKKDFCDEYNTIKTIKQYILCVQESVKYSPVEVKEEVANEYVIFISSSIRNTPDFNLTVPSQQKVKIKIEVEDTWGVPQSIRGKSYILKYPTLFGNV